MSTVTGPVKHCPRGKGTHCGALHSLSTALDTVTVAVISAPPVLAGSFSSSRMATVVYTAPRSVHTVAAALSCS